MAVTITVQPQDQQVVLGGTLDLSVTATGSGTLHYQWKQDGDNVGSDQATFQALDFDETDRGIYTVDVIDDDLVPVTSDDADVTVEPKIIVQPEAQAVVIGGTLTLGVTATGYAPLSYQWKKGVANVGTDSDTLVIDPYADSDRGSYTVEVTCDGNTVVSDPAVVTTLPDITTQPENQAVEIGGALELTVVATGHSLSYQWKKGVENVGTDSDTLTIDPYADADRGSYTVEVTSDGHTVVSDAAVVTTMPKITEQPEDTAVAGGDTLTLSVTTTGHSPLSYQWKKNGSNIGTNSATYTKTKFDNSDRGTYKVVVTCDGNSVTSDEVAVTTEPKILVQPQSQKIEIGDVLTLSVVASGHAPISYQWKHGVDNVGTDSTTLVIDPYTIEDDGVYTVEVTCDGNKVTSDEAEITSVPVITEQPADAAVEIGGTLTLHVVAEVDASPTYQWKKNGVNVGTNSDTYTKVYADSDRGSYTVDVTVDDNTVTSRKAAVTTKPKITAQPVGGSIPVNGSITMSVTATGHTPLSYQWKRDGNPIFGKNESTLTINPYTDAARGIYTVEVGCDGNYVTSDGASVVETVPLIAVQPVDTAVIIGQPLTLSVLALGHELLYQWYKDDAPIETGVEASLVIPSYADGDRGTYKVEVASDGNIVESNEVEVTTMPNITVQPVGQDVVKDDELTLSVTATGHTPTYQWYLNGVELSGETDDELDITFTTYDQCGSYTCKVTSDGHTVESKAAILQYADESNRKLVIGLPWTSMYYPASFFKVNVNVLTKDANDNPLTAEYTNPALSGYKLFGTYTYNGKVLATSVEVVQPIIVD